MVAKPSGPILYVDDLPAIDQNAIGFTVTLTSGAEVVMLAMSAHCLRALAEKATRALDGRLTAKVIPLPNHA